VLAGCAAAPPAATADRATPSAAPSPTDGRTAPSPDDGQVVVALDDFAALGALSVGVTPDLVLEAFDYATTSAIFDDLGLATEPYGAEPGLERVAAARPDVILGVSLPTTSAAREQLDAIAPTTVVDYTAGWREQLDQIAGALGREDAAAALAGRVDDAAAALAEDLAAAGRDGTVVSVVGDNGGLFSVPEGSSVGSVLARAGLARPPAQTAATDPTSPFVTFSAETLADHDGDVVYLLSGGPYATEGLTSSPLWPGLGAVASGAVHEVSGELWLATSPFAVDWVLRNLRATLLDGDPPADPSDAPARFAAFAAP